MASQTRGVDNSPSARNILQYAQNPFNQGGASGSPPRIGLQLSATQNQIIANPMFGRPIWSYIKVAPGAVRGPQPRLAQGTGHTGDPSLPGNAARLPGYLSDQQYEPVEFTYAPPNDPRFQARLPRTINVGDDGLHALNPTYRAHENVQADRWQAINRKAEMWEVMEFPPGPRNLLAWQQVQKYRLMTLTLQARPLTQDNYFLGYQVQPQVQANIGQTTLGYMGSQ